MQRSISIDQKNFHRLIYLLAILKFGLPYLIQNHSYEPHRDEFLYLAEAHHLAWGYMEVPPMMSFFGYLTNLFGGSLFWIKFWPSLFGAFTYILVARLILLFEGRWFALFLGFMPFVLGYYMHVHFMLQPGFLEVFFWTLIAYGLIYYVKTNENSGLYIMGIAFGLGMLSKYSVLFFATGILIALIITKRKDILRNKHFYYAILIGIVLFLPNIIWEWCHGFPIVYQMKQLQHQQLQYVGITTFLTEQLLYNLPCIFIWVTGLFWLIFSPGSKPYRFIGWAVIIAIIIIVIGHGKGYYGMGAYPILFVFGAVYLEKSTTEKFTYLRYLMVVFSIVIGCILDTVSLPFLAPKQLATYYGSNTVFRKLGFLQWEDQKDHPLPQDFADMLSWEDMTAKVAKVYGGLDSSDKRKAIIDGDNYGECAAIDYYGVRYHLAPAMGHAATYLFWTPEDFYKKDIFILTTDDRNEAHDNGFMHQFKYAAIVDSITNPYAREFGSYILLLKYPNPKFRMAWKKYYDSLKQESSIFNK